MKIIPAIDIYNQEAVRLKKGDYASAKQVSSDVFGTLKEFDKAKVSLIHLVDLNGAKEGSPMNRELIMEIASQSKIPVEIGGGIRNMETIDGYLSHGIKQVILGTSALEDLTFLNEALIKYPNQIVVGMDVRNGYVYGRGWLEGSKRETLEFAKQMQDFGIKTLIVTDIEQDGMMKGPNLALYQMLKENTNLNIIASGGVSCMADLESLAALGVEGAIVGKAYYEGKVDLQSAVQLYQEELC